MKERLREQKKNIREKLDRVRKKIKKEGTKMDKGEEGDGEENCRVRKEAEKR